MLIADSPYGINQIGRPDTPDCLKTYARINAQGGDATCYNLINDGIWGTDHIMMWDNNSDQIAGIVLDWIKQHVVGARALHFGPTCDKTCSSIPPLPFSGR